MYCTNCKKEVELIYLGEERTAVSDLKIRFYGCPYCETVAKVELGEKPFEWGCCD